MRIALVLVLVAGCPSPPAQPPGPTARTTADGTCADVAWSCVAHAPGAEAPWGCLEGNAAQRDQYAASCTPAKDGRFALGACLRDDLVAGCTLARGAQCTTTWYYAPATRASVEADCATQGAQLVLP